MVARTDAAQNAPPALSPAPRVLLVVSPYYEDVAVSLEAGARAALGAAGAEVDRLIAPGALEIPIAIRMASSGRAYEGFVALGCVVRGETSHYDIVAGESARALMDLGVGRALAIGNGVLTVDTLEQARVRADVAGQNKGGAAADAALHLIAAARRFRAGASAVPSDDAPILLA